MPPPKGGGRSTEPPGQAAAEAMSGAAFFQQLAAGAPRAPLDDDEPATRILTDPSERDRVLQDHYNLLEVCVCRRACTAPPPRHLRTLKALGRV